MLILLRREVFSCLPKPFKIHAIEWMDKDVIAMLNDMGIKDSYELLAVFGDEENKTSLSDKAGQYMDEIRSLYQIADLCRVQWVSPLTARLMVAARRAHNPEVPGKCPVGVSNPHRGDDVQVTPPSKDAERRLFLSGNNHGEPMGRYKSAERSQELVRGKTVP
ncbi:MAG: DUF4332 domain-containing protein [Anaerolineaceae bacterium]|nr:DUF4332 domain-containing protein [Anaerolineaceae bacterium]MBN2676922.1 DUF4332 domain-containing protein [Anaerolineaceae bacterium]